jgi:hypothetical protein
MALFGKNTLTQHETAAIATLMLSKELSGLLADHAVKRAVQKRYLAETLGALAEFSGSPKTVGVIRQRTLITFVSLTARNLANTAALDHLQYLATLALSYEDMLLTDIERCPDELLELWGAVLRELQRNRLV